MAPLPDCWARSGGKVWTHQVVSWHVSAHAFYSSNADPQHHARVWTSEIQIHCDIPCVACMLFGHVSSQPPRVIFTHLGCTYQMCIPTVSWHISAHVFYSSNPDPQHHARVWTSEIQIHCDIPCVTCMLFGHISSQPPCVIFTHLGRTYQMCIPTVHAVQSHFRKDRVWQTLPQEDLVKCSLEIFTSPSKFSCLAQPSL